MGTPRHLSHQPIGPGKLDRIFTYKSVTNQCIGLMAMVPLMKLPPLALGSHVIGKHGPG